MAKTSGSGGRATERLLTNVTQRRWLVVIVSAAAASFAAVGLGSLQADYSAEQFFLFQGSDREIFDRFKAHFPTEDLQVSAVLAVSEPLALSDFHALSELAKAFEYAGLERVRWVGDADLWEEVIEEGELAVRFLRLAEEADLTEGRLREVVEERRDHPLWSGMLWNRDLTAFAVHGFLPIEENTDERRRVMASRLEAAVDSIGQSSGRIVLTGLPILRVTVPLALEADLGRLLGIGILVAFGVLYLWLRRLVLVVLCILAVVPAILLTLGAMGLVGRPISVLTSFMPIVVLVVGVSDAIHLVRRTELEWHAGHRGAEGVVRAFAQLARACLFTSLTTALGFLGLIATRIGIIVEFGVVTAVAVGMTFLLTMTLLPALLSWVTSPGRRLRAPGEWSGGLIRRVQRLVEHRPVQPVLGLSVLAVAGLMLGAGLRVEAFLIDDLDEDDPIVEDLRWVEAQGFGAFQVNVFMRDMADVGHAPQTLQWIEALQEVVASDATALSAVGLPQVVREVENFFGEGDRLHGKRAWSEWSTEGVQELLFLSELRNEDYLGEVYDSEAGAGQVVIFVRDVGSSRISAFLGGLEAWIEANPPPAGTAHVTGTVKLTEILWDQLLSRFLPGVLFSVLLVWVALAIMFRSMRIGLLAVLPNLVPLAMLLGLMRLGGFDLKPSSVIVFAICFGIVVDDTIHLLAALSRRLDTARDLAVATSEAVREVGPALLITTAVVGAGFLALTASRFQALFLIGLMTCFAAIFALLTDLLGVPALLRLIAKRPRARALLEGREV